jgi:hypothetical protein
VSTPSIDGLRLSLDAPAEVAKGSPVELTLRIENTSSAGLDLYLRGREVTADIVVRRDDGTPVWQLLRDAVIPAILQVRTLEPGARLAVATRWDQQTLSGGQAPAGDYEIHAELLTDSPIGLRAPVTSLRITSREPTGAGKR